MELSSYQLDYSKYLKLDVACILNISPDHLDRHCNLNNYKKIKFKIFKFLKKKGIGLYQKNINPKFKKKLKIKSFNNINNKLLSEILGFKISISKKDLEKNKLPHRYEVFYSINNFKFINDSKSTNFDSTRYALKMSKNSILILGGELKKKDNFELQGLRNNIIKTYLFGKNISLLKKSFKKQKIKFKYFLNLKDVLKDIFESDYKLLIKKNKIIQFYLVLGQRHLINLKILKKEEKYLKDMFINYSRDNNNFIILWLRSLDKIILVLLILWMTLGLIFVTTTTLDFASIKLYNDPKKLVYKYYFFISLSFFIILFFSIFNESFYQEFAKFFFLYLFYFYF